MRTRSTANWSISLGSTDNVDWQPPAIEVIARRHGEPEFILRFLSDLERLAYGLFLMRNNPTDRIRRYGKLLGSIQASDDLFANDSPLQLDEAEKKEVRRTLDGDIYTVTRIRLPLLLRLDELLSAGSAVYNHPIVSVEHVLPQNPSASSQWLADFPAEGDREQWVHKLANLVLLTRRKNSQASNLDFRDKKSKYFSTGAGISNFTLTNMVLSEAEKRRNHPRPGGSRGRARAVRWRSVARRRSSATPAPYSTIS